MSALKPCQIKATMMLEGILQQDIAEDLGVDASLVNKVVNSTSKNLKVRTEIARRLGMIITDIWPEERYRRPTGRIVEPARAAA
ncbi:MAG: hypothetical protein COZ00_09180 [Zetaproteobacteria bacterium CG_4_10_14_0_8_um_filter_49_80]|nr:MAG: hypothetical protein COZ00_09180 [Zetaproteobacteria bacterium CG_4_10_14_0_8_um_filter_49_80]